MMTKLQRQRRVESARMCGNSPRRGSTLLIAIVLLTMLMMLGFLLYTITAQEAVNAEYFADAKGAKILEEPDLDPQFLFDFTLRQVIMGARIDERHSMFWGGRHSLLPNMFGRDLHAFSGQGVNLAWDATTERPIVDMDHDGFVDNPEFLDYNDSPAAQAALLDLDDYPEPDADYTAADFNSSFLSHKSSVPDETLPLANPPKEVRYPSYHRPQILRNTDDGGGGSIPAYQWYTHINTRALVLVPHKEHRAIDSAGNVTTERRFISNVYPDPDNEDLNFNGILDGGEDTNGNTLLDVGLHHYVFNEDADDDGLLGPFEDGNGNGTLDVRREGHWSLHGDTYEFDADPTGDNTDDAFYIDVNSPLFEAPDGSKFVFMPAITIIDADALMNLNTAGNLAARFGGGADGAPGLAGVNDDSAGDIDDLSEFGWPGSDDDLALDNPTFGNAKFLSRSNQSISPSEVNPQYGLYATPAATSVDFAGDATALNNALEQHRMFFGHNPTDSGPGELSNMEWYHLVTGRPVFQTGSPVPAGVDDLSSTLYHGRWGHEMVGEVGRLRLGVESRVPYDFPWPGLTSPIYFFDLNEPQQLQADDNLNLTAGATYEHPLDFRGIGRFILTGSAGKTRELVAVGRHQWPRYRDYFVNEFTGYLVPNADHGISTTDGEPLMPDFGLDLLIDDPEEARFDVSDPNDHLFGADEDASLHLSKNDLTSNGRLGRVLRLADFNFQTSLREREIREQFTATSWDLKSYGKPFFGKYVGTDDAFRKWEYFDESGIGDGPFVFPPTFGTVPAGDAEDPFRDELREMLRIQFIGDTTSITHFRRPQRRLSIDGLLERDQLGRLRTRPLTEHPTGLGNDPVVGVTPPAYPELLDPTDLTQQEALARYDRQRMARDIYVLLYTLGGGNDTLNYTSTNDAGELYGNSETHELGDQTRAMAQLAVNWVDAHDPDDTITVFEYDSDLGDGWNLDDNAYTEEVDIDRQEVYGVELQKLAFNEAMLVFAPKDPSDLDNTGATEWSEEDHRDFTYIEIQNVGPRAVSFANDAWQLVVRPLDEVVGMTVTPKGLERRLTLRADNSELLSGAVPDSLFAIGTAGDTSNLGQPPGPEPVASFMMVNPNLGHPMDDTGVYSRIVPRGLLNLDLILDGIDNPALYRVNTEQASGDAGDGPEVDTGADPQGIDLLHILEAEKASILNDGDVEVTLEIRRRANLNRVRPIEHASDGTGQALHEAQSADNPWIVVDTITVPLDVFTIENGDDYVQIQPELTDLQSWERLRPLYRSDDGTDQTPVNGAFQANSLGEVNENDVAASQVRLWQPHFDRDFASVAELFDLPLYGPDELTARLGDLTGSGAARVIRIAEIPTVGIATTEDQRTTGSKLLSPDFPDGIVTLSTRVEADLDNRWYRLLEFVELPTRIQRHDDVLLDYRDVGLTIDATLANPAVGFFRVPGKINLNTLRHPSVLAGLLDDGDVIGFDPNTVPGFLDDASGDATRDWWVEFIKSRDGVDPLPIGSDGSGLNLPGLPTSRPFRSLAVPQEGLASIESTVLRSLRLDNEDVNGSGVLDPGEDFNGNTTLDADAGGARRKLLELGNAAEEAADSIEYTTRNRLLAKLMNNTTVRSNVFLIFVQIDYFEAKEVDVGGGNTVVRIGGKRDDSPAFRKFYVVDRSQALELLEPEDLPVMYDVNPEDGTDDTFTYTFNSSTFNFRSLILHEQRLD